MPVQEYHDLSDGLLLCPRLGDLLLPRRADAVHVGEAVRVGVDDLEGPLLVRLHDPPGQHRADALDHPAGEVFLNALGRGRRGGAEDFRLELLAVFLVDDPPALGLQPLAGPDLRQRADDRHQLTVAAGLDAQHAEAGFVVVERHALDEAGELVC